MKIYSKKGDKGTTSFYDGNRASKFSLNFEVLGEMDELSSRIGLLCVYCPENSILRKIQRTLQDFNTYIATVEKDSKILPSLDDNLLSELESQIDELELENTKLTKFILPGVTLADAQAHLCRTQARKAERCVICLQYTDAVIDITNGGKHECLDLKEFILPDIILKYMNRLSDFFFVFARWICKKKGYDDFLL